jgi:hypothetical protein
MKKILAAFCATLLVLAILATGCGGGGGGGGYTAPAAVTGSISGQIVNNTVAIGSPNLKAQAGGTEEVRVYCEQHPELETLADADGKFLLENVPPGKVFLVAEHRTPAGHLFRMRSGEISVEAAKLHELGAGLAVVRADQTFAGRVLNAKTKAVIEGVRIAVWGKHTLSAADGSFVIENLVSLNLPYSIRFEKTGYEPLTKSLKVSDADAQFLEIEMTPLPDTGSVTGRLADNGPLEGVPVICAQFPDIRTTTNAQGKFTLENIPAGKVRLLATVPFGESVMRGSAEVVIVAGQQTDISDSPIVMSVHSRTVHGFVDIPGHAAEIVGVKVSALGQSVLSNEIGYFKIEHLPAEKIMVTFEKAGLAMKTGEVALTTLAVVDLPPLAMEIIKPEDLRRQTFR